MKHCCKNCYFLSKLHVFKEDEALKAVPNPWTEDERNDISLLKDNLLLSCKKGIWHSQSKAWSRSQVDYELTLDRKDDCFFVEYLEGMGFDAADELQRRRYETRQFVRRFQYTKWGIWIAVFGLMANLLYLILTDYQIIP